MANRKRTPDTQNTEQKILNNSFDQDFDVLAVENLLYDGANLVRASADSNGVQNVSVSGVATSDNQTNGTQQTKLTDGTDIATIRDVTGAKALDVSIVDGSGNQVTSFGGGTQYAEGDTAVTITGTAMMFETDTATSTIGVVSATNPLPISDAGGSVTIDASGTQLITSTGTPASNAVGLVVRNIPTGTQSVSGAVNISNTVSVSSHPVTNAGTFAVQDSEKVTDNATFTDGSTKVLPAGYILDETAGTALAENDAAAARIDSKRAQVLVLEDATTRGRRQTVNSDGSASVASQGDVAHDTADSGNPVKVGVRAHTTNRTAVADADRADMMGDDKGRPVAVLEGVRDLKTTATVTVSNTTETTLLASGGAGVLHDALAFIATNTSASATRVDFRDATAGTVRFQLYLPAGDTRGFVLPVSWPQTTAANNWTIQLSTGVSDVRVAILAVKNT